MNTEMTKSFDKVLHEYCKTLDRAFFLADAYKDLAYVDAPLPIGYEQTISQPSLVWHMTELLDIDQVERILEIGTGSGYQTCILAKFAAHVFTVERIPELADQAKERLATIGFHNIEFKAGDGSDGWPEHAPYDRIIVTAACSVLPEPLCDQLKPGGKMIIPIGPQDVQKLVLIEKDLDGKLFTTDIYHVRFVEFKGRYGWDTD